LQLVIKLKTETQMDEPSVALDLGHQVSASGAPPLSFCFPEKSFVGGSLGLGFFSMRHSAISEQEVIFKNIVWVIVGSVVTWALAKNTCVGAYETPLYALGLDFMPPDQIANMSLNGLRR
jgi:hypothetical protein